jgi:hypothetical protein
LAGVRSPLSSRLDPIPGCLPAGLILHAKQRLKEHGRASRGGRDRGGGDGQGVVSLAGAVIVRAGTSPSPSNELMSSLARSAPKR